MRVIINMIFTFDCHVLASYDVNLCTKFFSDFVSYGFRLYRLIPTSHVRTIRLSLPITCPKDSIDIT